MDEIDYEVPSRWLGYVPRWSDVAFGVLVGFLWWAVLLVGAGGELLKPLLAFCIVSTLAVYGLFHIIIARNLENILLRIFLFFVLNYAAWLAFGFCITILDGGNIVEDLGELFTIYFEIWDEVPVSMAVLSPLTILLSEFWIRKFKRPVEVPYD